MMETNKQSNELDRENCAKDNRIVSSLEAGEKILLSASLWKFSNESQQQKRILLVTDRNLYNITPQSTLANIFSKVVSSLRVKRKIGYQHIQALIVSKFGYEFVIHVPEQYDYRYSCLDFRDKIIQVICQAYQLQMKKKLAFYFTDELSLSQFTTTKIDIKKSIIRTPKQQLRQLLDVEELKQLEFTNQKPPNQIQKICKNVSLQLEDLEIIRVIGRGSLAKITICKNKKNGEIYALKSFNKQDVIQTDHIFHIKNERKFLEDLDHPFLIKLLYSFQNDKRIFFVFPFLQGGDLFNHLKREIRFKEDRAKFYAAQLVLILGYLHDRNFVYRDLKPENILINKNGYLVLTDFGLSKYIANSNLAFSLVGTPDYMAPEMIASLGHNYMIDWWSLGVIIFEMIIGITPFYSDNQSQMFEYILNRDPKFPSGVAISNEAKDIILHLLKKEPKERLGRKGLEEVKSHIWFNKINWNELLEFNIPAPFVPLIDNEFDTKNFEEDFTSEFACFSDEDEDNFDKQFVEKFNEEFACLNYDYKI